MLETCRTASNENLDVKKFIFVLGTIKIDRIKIRVYHFIYQTHFFIGRTLKMTIVAFVSVESFSAFTLKIKRNCLLFYGE